MNMSVQNNIAMLNTQNKFKINTDNKAKSTEKLSSGYRINKAADDAAGLSISEKLRWQIRGLNQGTRNGQDGVSWVQIGDGALAEVQSMIHRMKELTVQALNDTNTPEDRAALQAEFDALQCEIDKVSDSTQFNTKNIFNEHDATYYQYEGNVRWNQSQQHVISSGANELTIEYVMDENSTPKQVTLQVPVGEYTTQEIADELEDAIRNVGADKEGIAVELTDEGTFNINLEGGQKINDVTGDLMYLLHDTYEGGSVGALIGTTYFPDDIQPLQISSENNNLSFDIEKFDGTMTNVNITLPTGGYARPEIVDLLNDRLAGTTVEAIASGSGIKLTSNEAIITGFKGNMFKIDGGNGGNVYTSVFYDNVKYGSISMNPGTLKGGAVLTEDSRDAEHQKFKIDSTNNQLIFQANDSDVPVTINIDAGEYTVTEMVNKLNDLFAANGLELTAGSYDGGSYKGLTITSKILGANSKVGLDSTSSAYNTLFVNRVHNKYMTDATSDRETIADRAATFTGSKSHTGTNVPLTIVAGQNDKFALNIDGTSYTITLDAGDYNTVDDLRTQIDSKLNGAGALAGYKGIVDVTTSGSSIKLSASPDKAVTNLSASAVGNNMGFDNVFVGKSVTIKDKNISNNGDANNPAKVTLNTPVSDPATIPAGDNKLEVTLDGVKHTVTLPTGSNVTHDDITNAIENTIKSGDYIAGNSFNDINARGDDRTNHFDGTGNVGRTTLDYKLYSVAGKYSVPEGSVGGSTTNIPAKVNMSVSLPETMTINSSNNEFQITLNGDNRNLIIADGTYTRSQLVSELQKMIDNEFGVYEKGAKVSLDSSNQLVFESRLTKANGAMCLGSDTSIRFSTNSSFIQALHTRYTAGYEEMSGVQNTITIDDSSNTFSFTYQENGVTRNVNAVLKNGTYNRTDFAKMLEQQLRNSGASVSATMNGSTLRLTTDEVGDGNSIAYSTKIGGTSADAIFGPRYTGNVATVLTSRPMQDSITIDDSSNKFAITINGTNQQVTLDNGTYDKNGFVAMLNSKLSPLGVNVTNENGSIRYTTIAKGSGASIQMTYGTGGTSMPAIYGTTPVHTSGVKAEFDSNNQLVLTRTDNGGSLLVESDGGSIFQEPETIINDVGTTSTAGYTSTKKSYVDGVNITEPVTIDEWNNDLSFRYYENGTNHDVNISLAKKDYTFAELAAALQSEVDAQAGAGEILVTVNDAGVRLETQTPGSAHYISESNFSGDFYYKVMCSTKEVTDTCRVDVNNGTEPHDIAYTVGRKDVKNKDIELKSGVNDTLSMDFTINGRVVELEMKLDPGTYRGQNLVNMIQKKLDDALVAKGFEAGTIVAGIGNLPNASSVVGANDANALNFQLSKSVTLPENGTYIIDGVSGNAAFSVFYQTDGELIPAYVKGAKDLSDGVTIEAGANTLSFDVDGTNYSLTIPEGEYTEQEIIDELNAQFTALGAPVGAEVDDGTLKISYNKLGRHTINNISGTAKSDLFFQENGQIKDPEKVKIQLSSNVGDYIEIDKPNLSTAFLGINSVVITRPKYANKALVRVDEALAKVSAIRSSFGAEQNRIEYAINSNNNKEENTQAAESRIRDIDMAREMVEYSKHNILTQSAQAMMAQINSSASDVIRLLQM